MTNGCETGCMHFTGGELRHHKDCQYYAHSLTEMLDRARVEIQFWKALMILWGAFWLGVFCMRGL